MELVDFNGRNFVFGANVKDAATVPAHITDDGIVTFCWKLSFIERIKMLFCGRLFLTSVTYKRPLQPLLPSLHNPIGKITHDPASFLPIKPEQNN